MTLPKPCKYCGWIPMVLTSLDRTICVCKCMNEKCSVRPNVLVRNDYLVTRARDIEENAVMEWNDAYGRA